MFKGRIQKGGESMDNIDRSLSVPLYYQIQEILEEKISSGEWGEGFQIPTEKELSDYFNVSSITVKRAVHELVNKGLLYRVRAKGTFVAKELKEENIFNLVTFGSEIETDNNHVTLNHSIIEAEKSILRRLSLKEGDKVLKLDRLKIDEDDVVAIERTYIVDKLLPNFPVERMETDLIYNVIRDESNVELSRARMYLSTTVATEEEATLLKLKSGTPLIILERISFLDTGIPIEYSKFIMRQDKAKYYFEVEI